MNEIDIFKRNLFWIRWLIGWTSEELGRQIGLTRQTITAIETDPNYRLTRVYYYAMRYVIDDKIRSYPPEYIEKYNQLLTEVFDKEIDLFPRRTLGRRAHEALFT